MEPGHRTDMAAIRPVLTALLKSVTVEKATPTQTTTTEATTRGVAVRPSSTYSRHSTMGATAILHIV